MLPSHPKLIWQALTEELDHSHPKFRTQETLEKTECKICRTSEHWTAGGSGGAEGQDQGNQGKAGSIAAPMASLLGYAEESLDLWQRHVWGGDGLPVGWPVFHVIHGPSAICYYSKTQSSGHQYAEPKDHTWWADLNSTVTQWQRLLSNCLQPQRHFCLICYLLWYIILLLHMWF